MTDGLNEEVQQAFAKLTRVPRPHLSERIRESIWGRPAPGTHLPPGVPAWAGPSVSPPAAGPAGQRSAPRRVLVAVVLVLALAAAALLVGPAGVGRRLTAMGAVFSPQRPAPTTAARPASTPVAPEVTPAAPASSEPTAAPATATPATAPPAAAPAPLPGYSCSAQSGGGGAQSTMTA